MMMKITMLKCDEDYVHYKQDHENQMKMFEIFRMMMNIKTKMGMKMMMMMMMTMLMMMI